MPIGRDRPSRLAGHRQQTDKQTDKHIAFYYVDLLFSVGVGDGGRGQMPPPKIRRNIFPAIKIRAFYKFFIHIFSGKMSCPNCPPPKLTELLRLCCFCMFKCNYQQRK